MKNHLGSPLEAAWKPPGWQKWHWEEMKAEDEIYRAGDHGQYWGFIIEQWHSQSRVGCAGLCKTLLLGQALQPGYVLFERFPCIREVQHHTSNLQ